MKVIIATAAYCSADAIRAQVESLAPEVAASRHRVTFRIACCSDFADVVAVCQKAEAEAGLSEWVYVVPYGKNVGLSRVWNDAVQIQNLGLTKLVILLNDDIVFGPGSLDILIDGMSEALNSGAALVCAQGHHRTNGDNAAFGYSCFAVSKTAYETVGSFDEQFWPAYCEDCDFSTRMKRAGLHEATSVLANLTHYGSRSILDQTPRSRRIRERNHHTHCANMAYYIRKWGGDPGRETYDQPFNGGPVEVRSDMEAMKALEWSLVGRYEDKANG